MSEIISIRLGARGLDFVREALEQGLSLSRAVLHDWRSDDGELLTFLPRGLEKKRALVFDRGGVSTPEASTRSLVQLVEGAFAAGPAVFVAENRLARRNDPVLARARAKTSFYEDEVYHWTTSPPEVAGVLRAAASHWQNCFVVGAREGLPETLSERDLRELARVDCLAVSAYDEEGFVIWRRKS
jgi:hypothetical protein